MRYLGSGDGPPILPVMRYRPEPCRVVLGCLPVVDKSRFGGVTGVCGTCMDARGITNDELVAGCHRSTLDELTEWTQRADQVLVF